MDLARSFIRFTPFVCVFLKLENSFPTFRFYEAALSF